ncbi:D-isomer specific 2-hydroxyacid dehydrogenase, partial [Helicosporidium sp. ATCC 50920]
MAQPTILVAEKLGAGGVSMLEEGSKVEIALGMTPAELLERVSQVDALIIRSGTQVTREVFEAAKGRLKVVGRAGVGIDNVDLAAASEHGCLVVNAPTANTVAAAEHAISLITSLARHVAAADASMKAGRWERNKLVGVSVAGKTLSVFGFGKVGAEVAKRARGLGMTVLTHDPYVTEERARAQGAKLVTFDEALAAGDFLSLHMPLLPSTRHVFNDAAFAKCKKGARLVNVARGAVVDDEAL